MSRRSVLALAAAMGAVIGLASGANAQDALHAKSGGVAKRLEQLAADRGRVRVIVELGPTAGLDSTAVTALSDAVLATHAGTEPLRRRAWSPRTIASQRLLAVSVTRDELAALAADPRVVRVHEDELHKPTLDSSLPVIGMPAAHALGATGNGMIVAVLDTGVDRSHPFLAPRVVLEACFSTTVGGQSTSVCPNGQESQTGPGAGMPCPSNVEGCAHGTHVAGIAAGYRTSGTPRKGVAYAARIFAIQVFSRFAGTSFCGSQTSCALSYTSDQIAALEHVEFMGRSPSYTIAAANMSLGGGGYQLACDGHPMKPIIDRLRVNGVATVIAAGNDGYRNHVSSPGCISSAVTVGAVDDGSNIASFTNMAAPVDLMAPGVDITSSVPFGNFAEFDGTSMATPHVAGAFAAIRSLLPWASVAMIERALALTGNMVSDTRTDGTLERPMIMVDLAIEYLNAHKPALLVSTIDPFESAGPEGGAFAPARKAYVLTNTTGADLEWTAAATAAWLRVWPASGTLAPGASVTARAQLTAEAAALPSGLYNATFDFTNVTSGSVRASRDALLEILQPFCADHFHNAQEITGLSGRTKGSTLDAHRQTNEPLHVGKTGGKSVWCKWVAPKWTPVVMTTKESDFDTLLAVYTGTDLDALTPVAASDNVGDKLYGRVRFNAAKGRTYWIAIDGKRGSNGVISSGTAVLTWSTD